MTRNELIDRIMIASLDRAGVMLRLIQTPELGVEGLDQALVQYEATIVVYAQELARSAG